MTPTGAITVPSRTRVIAVKATSTVANTTQFLASSTDGSIMTGGSAWKCSVGITSTDWMLTSYDDSSWKMGANWILNNGQSTAEAQYPSISSNAYWIYYKNQAVNVTDVNFRLTLSNKCKTSLS